MAQKQFSLNHGVIFFGFAGVTGTHLKPTQQCSVLLLHLYPWDVAGAKTFGETALVCFAPISLDEGSSSESRAGRVG